MKKKLMVVALAVLTVLMLAACGKGGDASTTISQEIAEDGKSCTVEAKDADEGDYAVSGMVIVEEGQKLQVVSDIEGDSTMTLEFCTNETLDSLGEDASADELEEAADKYQVVLTVEAGGSEISEHEIAPGEYYLRSSTTKGCTGTVKATVE